MCGRYTLTDPGTELLRHFQLPFLPDGYRPRYNIAPTQPVTAIIADGDGRRAGQLRWGLIPSWAKDPAIGNRMINARAETIAEKPSFHTAFRRRRCLIAADGFYEWQVRDGRKQPVRFVKPDDGVFAFAGLWESWRPPGPPDPRYADRRTGRGSYTGTEQQANPGAETETDVNDVIYTCTIITTEANAVVRPVHHRMPVIIAPEDYDLWLDRAVDEPDAVLPLLRSAPEDALRMYDVSTFVNSPRNEAPDCIAPLTN